MDEFVEALVADLTPVRPRRVAVEAAALIALFILELSVWLLTDNMRDHLLEVARTTPTFWWKLGGATALAVVGCATVLAALDPAGSPRRGMLAMVMVLTLFLAVGGLLDMKQGLGDMAVRLPLDQGLQCFTYIVSLSVPPLMALAWLMRRGAPTHAGATALACGLAAAGWGALVFVFTCPHDDPLFVAVWYPAAALASALASRLILPVVSRW